MLPRREFLKTMSLAGAATVLGAGRIWAAAPYPLYKISLAQWSFHRLIAAKEMDHLDFAVVARKEYDIEAVEYCSIFFADKALDEEYLNEMQKRAKDHNVRSLLIMVDREGPLGDPDPAVRKQTVENHKKWLSAAAHLGCHSIRVNAQSKGEYEDQISFAADGLRQLTEIAEPMNLNVIVENHGGTSSNGAWLAEVMRRVDHPHCGTLPDFGNFQTSPGVWYDRYQGVEELMPFAKAVSAKTHDFDEQGFETKTDYKRMMQIVLDAGYHGFVGIEYEGRELDERTGVRKSLELLLRVRDELATAHA